MFDIGFPELMLVAIITLLVMGPQRLPEAMRTVGLWWGRFSRSFNAIRAEIEREVGMDEVRRQIYNESIMADLERAKREVSEVQQETRSAWHDSVHGGSDADISTPAPPAVANDSPPAAPRPDAPPTSRAEALQRRTGADGEQPLS